MTSPLSPEPREVDPAPERALLTLLLPVAGTLILLKLLWWKVAAFADVSAALLKFALLLLWAALTVWALVHLVRQARRRGLRAAVPLVTSVVLFAAYQLLPLDNALLAQDVLPPAD